MTLNRHRSFIRRSWPMLLLVTAAVALPLCIRNERPVWDNLRSQVFETLLRARIEPAAQVNISADYTARVTHVYARAGQHVHAGDQLITLDNAEIANDLAIATKRVAMVRSRLDAVRNQQQSESTASVQRESASAHARDAAQERLDAFKIDATVNALSLAHAQTIRVKELVRQHLATSEELERAVAAEASAEREVAAAREHLSRLQQEMTDAQLQLSLSHRLIAAPSSAVVTAEADLADAQNSMQVARQRASRLQIAAPADGVVLDLAVRDGDPVSAGSVIARIADLSSIALITPVTAEVARAVRVGTPVEVHLPSVPAKRFWAPVHSITLVPDASQHAYLIKVVFPNPAPDTILVGLEAEIGIHHQL